MRRWTIVALVAIPILVAAGWLALFSPWLAVDRVDVTVDASSELAGPLSQQEILAAAQVDAGTPMLRVSTDAIQQRIEALPQVKSASVSRSWPDAIVVNVARREPVAVVATGAEYDVVDAQGVVIRRVAVPGDDVPVVRASGDGLGAAITVAQGLPESLRLDVTAIEATTRNDVTLLLRDGAEVMWGSAQDGEVKAEVLQALFQVDARFYDVSAPGVPATSDTPRRSSG